MVHWSSTVYVIKLFIKYCDRIQKIAQTIWKFTLVCRCLQGRPIRLGHNHRLNVEEKKNNRPRGTNPRPPMHQSGGGGRGSYSRMDGNRGPPGGGRGGYGGGGGGGPRRS